MAKQSERTLQMKKEYMNLRNEGYTIEQIAKKFGLSMFTVYHYLNEIAKEHDIPREELLDVPHSRPVTYERQFTPVKPIDSVEFDRKSKEIMSNLDNLCAEIGRGIAAFETAEDEFEKEEESWQQ